MKKRIAVLSTMLLCMSVFGACGDKSTETTSANTEVTADNAEGTEEQGVASTEEQEVLPEGLYRSELTNELIDVALKDQRPVAIMVDNESIALPHYGLTQADVVYEMMNSTLNGRVTRLMALVKDYEQITQFGSIRSARSTNVILAAEWNAILVHDGGPFYIDEYLAEPCSDNFSGGFGRVDNGKSREFTEYVLKGDLHSKFASSGVSETYTEYYEGPHFQFVNEENALDLSNEAGAVSASAIELPFPHNSSELAYNADDQLYYYSEYGDAHLDPENDNAQLCFKNVLLQCCDFEVYDENGYMVYNCIGKDTGYYITNGKAIKVTWSKSSMTSPTQYFDEAGNEIKLNTGKTYIALVPSDSWSDLVVE